MKNDLLEEALSLQVETIDRAQDFIKKMAVWNKMLLSPPSVNTGLTPSETVYRKHKMKLQRYLPDQPKAYRTPILIAFALVNKPYILDLIPGKSVIEVLANAGFDVYMIDWGIPSHPESKNGLDKYVNYYMDRAVDKVMEISGADKVTLLGYCMGGAMSLMYTALHPDKVKNLVLMATPFDFSKSEGILYKWSKDFPVDELIDIYGNCPGWYLNLSFAALKPMGMADKTVSFFKNMQDEKFLDLFLAMEKWVNDAQPVPGKAYSEFVKGCFQKDLLRKNRFTVGERIVDLGNVKCPLLNIVAEQDHLVPPSSSKGIGDYVASADKELLTCQTGHIGLSVSRKALKKTWPAVVEWLKKRS